MEVGEFVALLATEIVPETPPVVVGLNATVKVVDFPEASVRGRARPETAKPLPAMLSLESARLALPVFERVTVFDELLPIGTLPKLNEFVEDEICGLDKEATPLPVNEILTVRESPASISTVTVPVSFPAAVGAKLTEKSRL